MTPRNEELVRLVIGCLIFVATFVIASRFAETRAEIRHAKYIACVESGQAPLTCSFAAAFEAQ